MEFSLSQLEPWLVIYLIALHDMGFQLLIKDEDILINTLHCVPKLLLPA